ncbi:hypothetical protein [Rhizobium leguminosarum]|uniref:hypothetical protein n=1 Tax=Rhizobium leguminosarum TaxID=384 RepID=UPI003F4FF2C3
MATKRFFEIAPKGNWERAFKILNAKLHDASKVASDLAIELIERNSLLYSIMTYLEAVGEDGHPYKQMGEPGVQTAANFIWMVGNVFEGTTNAGRTGIRSRIISELTRDHGFASLQVEMNVAQLALHNGAEIRLPEFESDNRQRSEPDVALRKSGITWWAECKLITYDKGRGFTRTDFDAIVKHMVAANFERRISDRAVEIEVLTRLTTDTERRALVLRVVDALNSDVADVSTPEFRFKKTNFPAGTLKPLSGKPGREAALKVFAGSEVGFVFSIVDDEGCTDTFNVTAEEESPLDIWYRHIDKARSQLGEKENKIVACQIQNLFRAEIEEYGIDPVFDLTAKRAMTKHPELCHVIFSLQGTVPTAFSSRDEREYSRICSNPGVPPSRLILNGYEG